MIAVPVLVPVAVYAQAAPNAVTSPDADINGGLCQGANLKVSATTDPKCDANANGATTDTINKTIALVINVFSLVVGVAAVIMIIIGGMRYIISGGDSGNVTSAKNTILYAIIGLVVVALAQFVVKFVLTRVVVG